MRHMLLIPLICLFIGCSSRHPANDDLWNDGWKFALITDTLQENDLSPAKAGYSDTEWEPVMLPHTARTEPYVISGKQWQGICWYRKHFTIAEADTAGRIILTLEGAMNNAVLWLNGNLVAMHSGGFLPIAADLTDRMNAGDNILAVRLDNHDDPLTGPSPLARLDFNTYGGLYRNARLIVGDRLHFTDPLLADDASAGVYITTRTVDSQMAVLGIRAQIGNDRPEQVSFRIRHRLIYDGDIVAEAETQELPLDSSQQLLNDCELRIPEPHLWSPDEPNLYTLKSEIVCDGKRVDCRQEKVGIRTVEFHDRELLVNGQKTFLRGVNRHQDYPHVGYAAPDNAQWRDAVKIKQAGFDYVRLSHYPPSPAFLDACDELGLFVLDAIPGWQYFNPDPKFAAQIEQTARDMIRRDRNHPCVLAWEVSLNETDMPRELVDRLCRAAHEEDPARPTAGWCEYGYDLFLNARQHRLEHETPTRKPLNVSEYGDWEYYAMNAGFNQDTWADLQSEERSSRQLRESGEQRLLQQVANIQEAHNDNLHQPAFADGYWVMFDYNRGYAPDLETSGVMSYDRMPKFSYDFFRSQRPAETGGPMVAIASYWDASSSPDIRVFSNCTQVELSLNGRSLGKQEVQHSRISDKLNSPPFIFHAPGFEAGELHAVGYIGGEPAAEQTVRTPETIAALRIEIDDAGVPPGHNDLLFIRAHAVDRNGTIVHSATGDVVFSLTNAAGATLVGDNPAPPLRAGTASALLRTPNHAARAGITVTMGRIAASRTLTVH